MSVAPVATRSRHIALEDLGLERLDLTHLGEHTYPLAPRLRALSLRRLLDDLQPLP